LPALRFISINRENAEIKGKARFRDILNPGSRQLNAGSSNNRISGSPRWIRTTVHGPEKEYSFFEKEYSFFLLSAAPDERILS